MRWIWYGAMTTDGKRAIGPEPSLFVNCVDVVIGTPEQCPAHPMPSPTPGPTPAPVPTCVDSNPSCSAWAASGECERNPSYMKLSCKKSCGLCPPGNSPALAPTSGADTDTSCSAWAASGECKHNPSYMRRFCKESCSLCSKTATSSHAFKTAVPDSPE